MICFASNPEKSTCAARRRNAMLGFTLVEVLVAFGLGTVAVAGAVAMMLYALKGVSLATAQTQESLIAGNALDLIESRIRLATMISNGPSGNTLTLAYDTNNLIDSSNGVSGVAWANQDRFEQFKFVGVNTTNVTVCKTNQLIWIPNTALPNIQIPLIAAGVRNLPGHNIFSVTNTVLASICFGIVDINSEDYYNGIEIQAMAASLNRPQVNNMLTILPAP